MQTLNHIYQLKYTQANQVSEILYVYDISNIIRLLFGFSIYASGPSRNWNIARLGIDNVSIASNQINVNCV